MVEGLDPPPAIKPGIFTSEFWSAAAASVGSLLTVAVVLFRVPPDTAASLAQAVSGGLVALGTVLGAAWTIGQYIQARVGIKQQALMSAANVAMQRIQSGESTATDRPIPYQMPKGV